MFILINATRLLPDEKHRKRMDETEQMILDTPADDDSSQLRLAGARALQSLKGARENGMEIAPKLLSSLYWLAGR